MGTQEWKVILTMSCQCYLKWSTFIVPTQIKNSIMIGSCVPILILLFSDNNKIGRARP